MINELRCGTLRRFTVICHLDGVVIWSRLTSQRCCQGPHPKRTCPPTCQSCANSRSVLLTSYNYVRMKTLKNFWFCINFVYFEHIVAPLPWHIMNYRILVETLDHGLITNVTRIWISGVQFLVKGADLIKMSVFTLSNVTAIKDTLLSGESTC